MTDTRLETRGGRLSMPRSRGATSGFLLILLGAWGALVPFIGPYFHFAFSPDQPWAWTAGRGWLQVLPGAVTALGGLFLLISGNRATAMLGGWLAVAGGAWFIVGRALAGPLGLPDAGAPVAGTEGKRVLLELTYFYGLGALIVFLGAAALGRLSVRSVRDIRWAERPVTAAEPGRAAVAEPAPVATGEHAPVGTGEHAPVGTGEHAPAAAGTPAMSEQRTEVVGPTAETAEPRRRGWRDMFRGSGGGGQRFAHR